MKKNYISVFPYIYKKFISGQVVDIYKAPFGRFGNVYWLVIQRYDNKFKIPNVIFDPVQKRVVPITEETKVSWMKNAFVKEISNSKDKGWSFVLTHGNYDSILKIYLSNVAIDAAKMELI